jgi:hypothetical protein
VNATVSIALFGFIPLVIVLFALFPARKAIFSGMILGWLFLPVAKISVVGIPDFSKVVATNIAVFLGCLLFHSRDLFRVQLSRYDLPIFLWMFAPSLSSLTNDLGWYDAGSVGLRNALTWFLPYWIGRAFVRDAKAFQELAVALMLGGLIYLPFCLFEVRMSPQLHNAVYGFHQNQFWRNIRFDGFRPTVFMESGLMVGMWMATAALTAFWLRMSGQRRLGRLSLDWIFAVLFATTILCKALYAIMLMFVAIGLLTAARLGKTALPLALLVACVPSYMVLRATQTLPAEILTTQAARLFGEDRAQSLGERLYQEDVMIAHAMHRWLFGWGGWLRAWPVDDFTGESQVRGVDGMWTIAASENGLYGIVTLFATLLTPVVVTLVSFRGDDWGDPKFAPIAIGAVCLLLFTCDCILNGMFNPIYVLVAGALISVHCEAYARVRVRHAAPVALVSRNLRRVNGN